MMTILILLSYVFFVLGFYFRRSCSALREAMMGSFVLLGAVVVVITEILNFFQGLNRPCLTIAWSVVLIMSLLFVFKNKPTNCERPVYPQLEWFELIQVGWIGLTVFLVGITAWMAPPNTWDSLVYHMSRVAHWQQNQSLAFYPTSIKMQNYFSPFAEWVILHFQILSGSDRLANFVQWAAMVGSIVMVTLIVQIGGGDRKTQICSGFLAATVPMFILQGSSTQNDVVLSFWILAFIYYGMRWMAFGRWDDVYAGACSVGIAILTKGTAILWVTPFLIWMLWVGMRKFKTHLGLAILITVGMIILFNVGHWSRNVELTGRVTGEEWVTRMTTMEKFSWPVLASNLLRNLGLHCGTSIKPLNQAIKTLIIDLHNRMGVDIADPATTFLSYPFDIAVTTFEDNAGMFCQLILIILAGLWVLLKAQNLPEQKYFLAGVTGILLFNVLIKWQPSGSRLHLPVFMVMMPLVARMIMDLAKQKIVILAVVMSVLISTSVPYLFRNSSRKLFSSKKTVFAIPRLEQYFVGQKEFFMPYQQAVEKLKSLDCQDVGLRIGDNGWEYPFWVLLKKEFGSSFRMEHVDAQGLNSQEYPLGAFHPCAIIETSCASPADGVIHWQDARFSRVWAEHPVNLYRRE